MTKAKAKTAPEAIDFSEYKTSPVARASLTENNCFEIFKVKFLPANAEFVGETTEMGRDSTLISFLETHIKEFIEAGKPVVTARLWWDEQKNDIVFNAAEHVYSPVSSDIQHKPLVHEEVQAGKHQLDFVLCYPQEGFEFQGPYTPVDKILIRRVTYK